MTLPGAPCVMHSRGFEMPFVRRRRTVGLAVGALLAMLVVPSYGAGKATTHTVVIKAVSYQPPTLTVKRGDMVIWVNEDPIPHTVTSKGAFDSKSIAPGASWKYHATKVGTYHYTCTFHPNMLGTLKVEQ